MACSDERETLNEMTAEAFVDGGYVEMGIAQLQAALAQVTRERDEALSLANSLRVCLDAAEAERHDNQAQLAVAEPKAAALDALGTISAGRLGKGWLTDGYGSAYQVFKFKPPGHLAGLVAVTLPELGTALLAREAAEQCTPTEEVTGGADRAGDSDCR